eukprot:CAMPEP_0172718452 /NCGR_PEP_ID=MMETSP1074-20121228/74431_1 /TAXON_ID=2916 /ORGANISM="Ceratium fusus, Strain PA161109" /LENGTH=64 /DNA_ID=CAMNT_0013543651 /DNA_START=67 /DNA_END=261 /DNA_ORIENTATION=-
MASVAYSLGATIAFATVVLKASLAIVETTIASGVVSKVSTKAQRLLSGVAIPVVVETLFALDSP